MDQQFLAQEVAAIALVSEKQPWLANGYHEQVRNSAIVGSFAAGRDEAERASLTACAGVDFR